MTNLFRNCKVRVFKHYWNGDFWLRGGKHSEKKKQQTGLSSVRDFYENIIPHGEKLNYQNVLPLTNCKACLTYVPNLHTKPHSTPSSFLHETVLKRSSSELTHFQLHISKQTEHNVCGAEMGQISHYAKIIRAGTGINAVWKIRTSVHCL